MTSGDKETIARFAKNKSAKKNQWQLSNQSLQIRKILP